jgi:hypothetical protein
MEARGLRNNNPGNLRHSANGKLLKPYTGEIRPVQDPDFRRFKSMAYGYRAMLHQLKAYFNRGLDSIEEIFYVYAPPSENNTEKYISDVVKWTGIPRNQVLKFSNSDQIVSLAAAISRKENGKAANRQDILKGYNLLNSNTKKSGLDQFEYFIYPAVLVASYYVDRSRNKAFV